MSFSNILHMNKYLNYEQKNKNYASRKKLHFIFWRQWQPNIRKGFSFPLVVWGKILRELVFVTVIYVLQKRHGNDNDRFRKISKPDKHGILVDMDWIWFAIGSFGDISK